MRNFKDHLVSKGTEIREALNQLNVLAKDAILFVVNDEFRLVGSLTDGDVRRGLINGLSTDNIVDDFIQPNPKFLRKDCYSIHEVMKLRDNNFKVIPVVDKANIIVNVINFRFMKSYLPVDAVVMAGGLGSRLKPLTDDVPKPLLEIAGKPIIEYNIERLRKFGVDDFWISLRYLGEQIEDYYKDGSDKGINIEYIWESEPLGTIGAVSKVQEFKHDFVLVTNSDILTTLDYEDFFLDFIEKGADMSVVTIPYQVNIPYAVIETNNHHVISFKEKPTYTYYSNGGIYLIKRSVLDKLPQNKFYNSTDLMQDVIETGGKLISFPIRQYWLDIGKPDDFEKAQHDIKHLDL